jgi:hypothetical protein
MSEELVDALRSTAPQLSNGAVDIWKQSWSWWKWSPELKINHCIVPLGRTDETLRAKMPPRLHGNCFAYNDKPRPLYTNWVTPCRWMQSFYNMHCGAIHDGEIFPNHGFLTMPAGVTAWACASSWSKAGWSNAKGYNLYNNFFLNSAESSRRWEVE